MTRTLEAASADPKNAWSGVDCFNTPGDHIRFMFEGHEFDAWIEADEDAYIYGLQAQVAEHDRNAALEERDETQDRIDAWARGEWSYVTIVVRRHDNPNAMDSLSSVESDGSYDYFRDAALQLAWNCLPENQPKWGEPTALHTVADLGCVLAVVLGDMTYDQIRSAPGGTTWLRMAGIVDQVTLAALRATATRIAEENWTLE